MCAHAVSRFSTSSSDIARKMRGTSSTRRCGTKTAHVLHEISSWNGSTQSSEMMTGTAPAASDSSRRYVCRPWPMTTRANRAWTMEERERCLYLDKLTGVPICVRFRRWPSDVTAALFFCVCACVSMLHNIYIFPTCLLYTSPSPRDRQKSRMPSSA